MKNNKKSPFEFRWTVPMLDWFEWKKASVNFDDYDAFKLVRRYGPTWWLIGLNVQETPYKIIETEIGELATKYSNENVKRFIEWAKIDNVRSKLVEISVISTSFDLVKEIGDLLK